MRRWWELHVRHRDWFTATDPGGVFIPAATVVGYRDTRTGTVHITRVETEKEDK